MMANTTPLHMLPPTYFYTKEAKEVGTIIMTFGEEGIHIMSLFEQKWPHKIVKNLASQSQLAPQPFEMVPPKPKKYCAIKLVLHLLELVILSRVIIV